MNNDQIVTRFMAAFTRMNADELIEYFTPDAIYHNIPLPPARGREEIYRGLKGLPDRFKGLEVETLNQIAVGDLVMNERIDYFLRADKRIAVPIAGVFEMLDGKIRAWREYFDLATFRGA